jgi:hypothetical protein
MRRFVFCGVVLGIFIVGLVRGPDLWAAPGQCPERQTVPTRTPTPPAPTPTKSPPETEPTPALTATVMTTPTAALSEPLLPAAGGLSFHLPLGAALIVVGFLALVMARRRA